MQNFRELRVWERSHELALKIYQLTSSFPYNELYGLVSRIQWADASIHSNIVEGSRRRSKREFSQFLKIAFGSSCELEYQIFLAHDLRFVGDNEYCTLELLISGVKIMLVGLTRKAQTSGPDY